MKKEKKDPIVKIEVVNFWKYQLRKDKKKPRWSRIENDIWRDPRFFCLTAIQKLTFIYLITYTSQNSMNLDSTSTQVRLNLDSCATDIGVRLNDIRLAVSRLQQLQLVKVCSDADLCPRIEENRIEENRGKVEKKETKDLENLSPKSTDLNLKTQDFIRCYCANFESYYSTNPVIGRKEAGLAKNILKTISLDLAKELVQVYFQIDNPWFHKRNHDLATFSMNLSTVKIAHSTGMQPGKLTEERAEAIRDSQREQQKQRIYGEQNESM